MYISSLDYYFKQIFLHPPKLKQEIDRANKLNQLPIHLWMEQQHIYAVKIFINPIIGASYKSNKLRTFRSSVQWGRLLRAK